MTLADMANLSQVIGAIGVVASLIFVGIQIRQNTAATRAASHNAVSDSLNEFNRMMAESADVSQLWLAGMGDRGALTDIERFRFDAAARAYMHVCETMYVQSTLGAGDKSILLAEEEGIRTLLAGPGFRAWWAENPYGFCAEFRRYVASLEPAPQ
jgi:hypothetical protein